MIKALHLDDRLIHGQVAISWTRFLDANVLLVINDAIVNDNTRKMALKMAVPPAVKYGFRSVEEGIHFLNGPDSQKYHIMALVSDPPGRGPGGSGRSWDPAADRGRGAEKGPLYCRQSEPDGRGRSGSVEGGGLRNPRGYAAHAFRQVRQSGGFPAKSLPIRLKGGITLCC